MKDWLEISVYQESSVIQTAGLQHPIHRSQQQRVKRTPDSRNPPFPCLVSVSEDEAVSDFEGLPIFVRLEECLTEKGVDRSEREHKSEQGEWILNHWIKSLRKVLFHEEERRSSDFPEV